MFSDEVSYSLISVEEHFHGSSVFMNVLADDVHGVEMLHCIGRQRLLRLYRIILPYWRILLRRLWSVGW